MDPRRVFVVALLSLAALPSAAFATWTHDPSTNLLVCGLAGYQINPVAVSDGVGGAFVVWQDGRSFNSANYDIYATHVLGNGTIDPAWPAFGAAVAALSGEQSAPAAVADGAGGVIIAWQDHRGTNFDIYAQRLNSVGANLWPLNGKQLTTAIQDETGPHIVSDGTGGAWVAWTRDFTGGDLDPVVNHVLANGTTPAVAGFDLDLSNSTQSNCAIASDDSGGCYVAYQSNAGGNYDIRLTRVLTNSTFPWNVVISAAANDQMSPVVSDDTHGGCYIAWQDQRAGSGTDVYGIRWLPNGLRPQSWISDGVFIAPTSGFGSQPVQIVPDAAGGAYFCYMQQGLLGSAAYAIRMLPSGTVASGWSTPGYALVAGTGIGATGAIADGTGGLIAAGGQTGGGFVNNLVEAAHVTSSNSTAAGWQTPTMICDIGAPLYFPSVAPDTKGGAIVVWSDLRNGADYDVFAQRIERFGQLGNPEPTIVNIKDVPNDQGGKVDVKWNASYLDAAPNFTVYDYRIWRQTPPATAQQALAHGATLMSDDAASGTRSNAQATRADPLINASRHVIRTSIEAGQTLYWELVGTQIASQQAAYGFTAPTNLDSVGAGNPRTIFYVDAYSGYQTHWDSPADSGYSVDNLPPVAPAPFTASFVPPNGTFLSWGANSESDLAGYRLYRGGGLNFTPAPGNRIYDGTTPSYHDATNTAFIYKVCAYDIHGNEGGCTTAQPPGTTDAPGAPLPKVLSLAPIDPNPSHGGADLRFGLPRDGRVTVSIYDAQGRRVRSVIDAWLPAGYGLTRWDGRNGAGEDAGSGVYFVRLEAQGQRMTQRFVRIE